MRDLDAEAVEAAARAHDREEAAQKGEPSPWRDLDYSLPGDVDWRDERIAAMRVAIAAYLSHQAEAGWRMMPREPSIDVEIAGENARRNPRAIWFAMFDANTAAAGGRNG